MWVCEASLMRHPAQHRGRGPPLRPAACPSSVLLASLTHSPTEQHERTCNLMEGKPSRSHGKAKALKVRFVPSFLNILSFLFLGLGVLVYFRKVGSALKPEQLLLLAFSCPVYTSPPKNKTPNVHLRKQIHGPTHPSSSGTAY